MHRVRKVRPADGAAGSSPRSTMAQTQSDSEGARYKQLADGHLQAGRLQEARVALEQAILCSADSGEYTLMLSDLWVQLGDEAKACRLLVRAQALAPRKAIIPFRLGTLYARARRFDEAEQELRVALRLARRDPSFAPYKAHCHHHLGKVLLERQAYERAAQHLQAAAQLCPEAAPTAELQLVQQHVQQHTETTQGFWRRLRGGPARKSADGVGTAGAGSARNC